MAETTWFRGEVIGGPVARPGGAVLHDFFDGTYLSDRADIAVQYTKVRLREQGLPADKGRVVAVTFDPERLGRVLDLRTDPRWAEYMRRPESAGLLPLLQTQQNYHNVFRSFCDEYKIDRTGRSYDFVIGPEYVRGGMQICIVHPDGVASELSKQLRAKFAPIALGPAQPPPPPPPPPSSAAKPATSTPTAATAPPRTPAAPATPNLAPQGPAKVLDPAAVASAGAKGAKGAAGAPSGVTGVKLPDGTIADWSAGAKPPPMGGDPTSVTGKVLKDKNAAAAIGVALGAGIQAIGDYGIRLRIEEEVQVRQRPTINTILSRGMGVLVIIRLKQWKRQDYNGMRARAFVSVALCGGPTQEEALHRWRSQAQLLTGPGEGWEMMPEQYAWIPPD